MDLRLRRKRMERGYSQGRLAKEAGLSRQVISNLERGYSHGYPETWQRIAAVLDTSVDELLEEPSAAGKAQALLASS
jgi:transcriptional regulator with XRE-family HTH domain